MKRVFADTFFWLAIANPADQWHVKVQQVVASLGAIRLVTTDEALTEFLAGMAGTGHFGRIQAVHTVHDILTDDEVTVLPQTHASFLSGLDFYERRLDKGYSLTDCISMGACLSENITDILTNDHHFKQEGFAILIHP